MGDQITFVFGRQILIDIPTQGNVQHLQAPADAQHGLVAALKQKFSQGQLVSVTQGTDAAAAALLPLAEEQGIHISPAGEKEAVQLVNIAAEKSFIGGEGEHHGQAALRDDGFHEIAAEKLILFLIIQPGGDADQRALGHGEDSLSK